MAVVLVACACGSDEKVSLDGRQPKDLPRSDLNCSFAARCVRGDAGVAGCYREQDPNPCCPGPVHTAITYACESTSGQCLYFADDCLPSGWTRRETTDGSAH